MNTTLTLNDEELEELEQVLLSEQKRLMLEVRRASPNSEFKAQLRHRENVVDALLDRIATMHKATA